MSNQPFGKYQLIKRLAMGGMADVWLATQTGIEGFKRHVVVKRILPHLAEDPEFVRMFLNEARIASRFNHPNIAQIFDLGETNGQYFIAMEFVHGEDLGRVMRRAWTTGQWVARHLALRIAADSCQALHYAHTRNDEQGRPLRVVHRDISPQNILVSFDGAIKLVDFGIAKASDQNSHTKSGAIKGKFAYMPPEQAAGKPLDARTDVFALGLVLYEMLTGVRPLKRDNELATLQAALECDIAPPSAVANIPKEFDALVMRALAKTPDDRYADAREFQRALEKFLLDSKELATSVEVAELMGMLFSDRLDEEARLGAPDPAPESGTGNPVVPLGAAATPVGASAPLRPVPRRDPLVNTIDDDTGLEPDLPPALVSGPPPFEPTVIKSPSSRSGNVKPAALRADATPPRRTRGEGSLPRRKPAPAQSSDGFEESNTAFDTKRPPPALGMLMLVIILGGALGFGFLFKDAILGALNQTALSQDGAVPIRLSVTSNPPVTVTIIPSQGSSRRPIELGRTPIDALSGAFVGDTVRLVNSDLGILWEEIVPWGKPNELKLISKDFKEVVVRVRIKPMLKHASVWRGNSQMGQVGQALNLYPGRTELEIRAPQLAVPHAFKINISDLIQSPVDLEVDVSSSLGRGSATQPMAPSPSPL